MSATKEVHVWNAEDGWRWYELTSSDKTAESGEAYENKADAVAQAAAHTREGYTLVIEED